MRIKSRIKGKRILISSVLVGVVAIALILSFNPALKFDYLDNILHSLTPKRFAEASGYGCNVTGNGNTGPMPYVGATPNFMLSGAKDFVPNDFYINDPNSDPLVFTEFSGVQHGTLTITNSGSTLHYQPNPNFSGYDGFLTTITDSQGGFVQQAVKVFVDQRTPQVFDQILNTVGSDSGAIGAREGLAPLVDAAGLNDLKDSSVNSLTATNGTIGTVSGSVNGLLYVTNNPITTQTTDDFTYTTKFDVSTSSATKNVHVNIFPRFSNPGNTEPSLPQTVNYSTAQDQPLIISDLLNNATSSNGPLSIVAVNNGSNGVSELIDSTTIKYTPTPYASTSDTFSYIVSDSQGNHSEATVYVSISRKTPYIASPVFNDDVIVVNRNNYVELENSSLGVTLNDINPGYIFDYSFVITATTSPQHGSITGSPGNLRYTPDIEFSGIDTFQYTARNQYNQSGTASAEILVKAVNRSPTGNQDSYTVLNSGPQELDVLANDSDIDGDPISIDRVDQPSNGSVSITNNNTKLEYTANSGYTDSDYLSYRVRDGMGCYANVNVTLDVQPGSTNQAPTANPDTSSLDENTQTNIDVLANDTDPENDTLTVSDVTTPVHGTANLNPDNTIKYTPAQDYEGTDTFDYTATDGQGNSSTATVSIEVNHVNHNPVAVNDNATLNQDSNTDINVLANDTDPDSGDMLTIASYTQPSHGSVQINQDHSLKYTPASGFVGNDSFQYTASDGNGGTSTASVSVVVNHVNHAPTVNPDTASVNQDGTVLVPVLTNDTDSDTGDTLSVQSVTQPVHGTTVINQDGTVSYTPSTGYSGSDSFSYIASDGNGGTGTATVSITVNRLNQAPTAVPDSITTSRDNSVLIDILANDTDSDGTIDKASVVIVTQPAKGSLQISPQTGAVTYAPTISQYPTSGSDVFSYKVKDNNSVFSNTVDVNVSVTRTNQAPTLLPQTIDVTRGQSASFAPLSGSDIDGDLPLTFSVTGLPSDLGCVSNDPSFPTGVVITCSPPLNAPLGPTTFQVSAIDSQGVSSQPVTFTLNVQDIQVTQSIGLVLHKDKPNVQVGEKYTVQASITNPNNFAVQNVVTLLTIDPSQLDLLNGTAAIGSISTQKYSSSLQSIISFQTEAQSSTTFQYIGNNQLQVSIPSMSPNQVVEVVFQVQSKVAQTSQVTGTTTIQNTQISSNAQIQLPATQPSIIYSILPRTGGLTPSLLAVGFLSLLLLPFKFLSRKKKPTKIDT